MTDANEVPQRIVEREKLALYVHGDVAFVSEHFPHRLLANNLMLLAFQHREDAELLLRQFEEEPGRVPYASLEWLPNDA